MTNKMKVQTKRGEIEIEDGDRFYGKYYPDDILVFSWNNGFPQWSVVDSAEEVVDFDRPAPDAKGFIKNYGCMPDWLEGKEIEIKYRDGHTFQKFAKGIDWSHGGDSTDVMKYRVVTEENQSDSSSLRVHLSNNKGPEYVSGGYEFDPVTALRGGDSFVVDEKWETPYGEFEAKVNIGGGRKDDSGKVPVCQGFMEYFPHATEEVAKVSAFGAEKYDWANCFDVPDAINRYSNAADRHRIAMLKGEVNDPESGLPHEAHMLWNFLLVRELKLRGGEK